MVPFRNQAERFESWLDSLKADRIVYKQPERHESCKLSGQLKSWLNEQPVARMAWKLAERFTGAYKQSIVLQARPWQSALILKAIGVSVGWVWLARLTNKAKNNMQKNWLASFPDCVLQFLSMSFYWCTWRTFDPEVLSRPVHARAHFSITQAGLLTRFLTSCTPDRF